MSRTITDGIHAVLFALFGADGTVDHEAMRRQIDRMIAAGVAGITVLGLATEVGKLSYEEQMALIALCGQHIDGRVTFSVTITGASLEVYQTKMQAAAAAGADWLILQPPSAGAEDAPALMDFFASACALTPLPVAIQNAPVFLAKSLSAGDLGILAHKVSNLKAVKAEDNALGLEALVRAAPGLDLVGGRGGLEMTDALRAGCRGFVLAPDIAPRAVRILDLWMQERTDEALALYAASLPAIVFVMQSLDQLITYGKRIYGLHAGQAIFDRSPAMEPTAFGLQLAHRHGETLKG